ncbi:MAG TPA: HAD family hydrolase [Herpetosiphonaceae bacterium]
MRAAVFLDRDGTVNVEVNYLSDPGQAVLEAGVAAAIGRLNRAGLPVVVVTNQSGIGRGYYGEADMHAVNRRLAELLAAEGARIDAWYWCPHHPDVTGPCACRKPGTGMFEQAARELDLDLARSWMVGDKPLDVAAGLAAGCRPILVTTGYGAAKRGEIAPGVPVADGLGAAAELILEGEAADAKQ